MTPWLIEKEIEVVQYSETKNYTAFSINRLFSSTDLTMISHKELYSFFLVAYGESQNLYSLCTEIEAFSNLDLKNCKLIARGSKYVDLPTLPNVVNYYPNNGNCKILTCSENNLNIFRCEEVSNFTCG